MFTIKKFVFNPIQENTYVVHDETKEAVIIDCGAFYHEERIALKNYISEHGLQLKHLLCTHGHLDHAGGIGSFEKIYASERDFDMIKSINAEELRGYCDNLGKQGAYNVFDFSPETIKQIEIFPEMVNVDDGYVFDLGGRTLPEANIIGNRPMTIANEVIKIGRRRAAAPKTADHEMAIPV